MPIRKSITGESVGDRISATREKRGLSASELARRLEVTPTAVWNWEKNGVVPRGPAIKAIATALNVAESYLREGGGELNVSGPGVATLAQVIERAKGEIAKAAGLPLDRVKLVVEFI